MFIVAAQHKGRAVWRSGNELELSSKLEVRSSKPRRMKSFPGGYKDLTPKGVINDFTFGGFRFHHISNGDSSGSNRGLNQFVTMVGFRGLSDGFRKDTTSARHARLPTR